MAGDALRALILLPIIYTFNISLMDDPDAGARITLFGVPTFLWSVCYTIPLLWRRTNPSLGCFMLLPAHLLQLIVLPSPTFGNLAVVIMLYAVAAYGTYRQSRWWLVASLVCAVIGSFSWTTWIPDAPERTIATILYAVFSWSFVVISWLIGAFNRERHNTIRSLKERAEAVEEERDRFVQLAAEQERSRIAREMHDIVAHSLSVIVVQTDGAAYTLDQPGDTEAQLETARKALATIGTTARSALKETRALVGVLREGERIDLAPQPQIADIDQLIEATRSSGLSVEYTVHGDPESSPQPGTSMQSAVFRIVQEGLTNVMKHAGPHAHAQVELDYFPNELVVSIRDDGTGSDHSDGRGHGLIGMRERVAPFGGNLTARNRLTGGFEVIATLPMNQEGHLS